LAGDIEMITWANYIGKLVGFLLSKVVGKKIDMGLDPRRKAVRAFLELHDALVLLERITQSFIIDAASVADGSSVRLYRGSILKIASDADQASLQLMKAFRSLEPVISIYDQDLANLLWGLRAGKGQMLEGLLQSDLGNQVMFDTLPNPDSVFYMKLATPYVTNMESELAIRYAAVRELKEKRQDDRRSWPKSAFKKAVASLLVDHAVVREIIADNDIKKISDLANSLSSHLRVLTKARQQLAGFIKENFSLTDILKLS
jgi:hypothetical protein